MYLSLRKGEKIYINGAIFRVDRRVSIELLNDVTFLLENHVMQADEATTPIRQLYFVVQLMLMSPKDVDATMELCRKMATSLRSAFEDRRILEGLARAFRSIEEQRFYVALRELRALFPIEGEVIEREEANEGKLDHAG